MPWQIESVMEQRLAFIEAVVHRRPGESIRDLCTQHGITEKTGHKWLGRFSQGGPAALADRSHAPRQPAHALPAALVDAIVAARTAHPTWGAKKLRSLLLETPPPAAATTWPAASTITHVLARHGLLVRRRRSLRERAAWAHTALTPATAPNDVWGADFKGEAPLSTGARCYPLTITDLASRFVVAVQGLASTASAPARAPFEAAFAAYGLPRVVRTDNGVPFGAPTGLGGLSALAVWWIRLGIRPERIDRGRPQQNGRHERMHKTLKAETMRPTAADFAAQQARFDAWRYEFNTLRPHESLGQTPPARHYTASPRPLPARVPPLDWPATAHVRRVDSHGVIKWRGTPVFLSTVLAGEEVGLEETASDEWTVRFGPLVLGVYAASLLAFREQLAWTPRGP